MAYITGKKTIFFVTSPRTPEKMRDEIKLLTERFSGKKWDKHTQKEFYRELSGQDFFEGAPTGEIDFKARDRINRAPKSLGFVDLKPTIQLTDAGKEYIYGPRPDEIFLRQLLKFQLSSPYHVDKSGAYAAKPYLELIRLIFDLGGLTKTEIALFVIQLTNVSAYSEVKDKILAFREAASGIRARGIPYPRFIAAEFDRELRELFAEEIAENDIETRQSKTTTPAGFLNKKKRNHFDYADAAIRYLRATNLFSFDPRSNRIQVIRERESDVVHILATVSRPILKTTESAYKANLFSPTIPVLLSDDKDTLVAKIAALVPESKQAELATRSISQLKDIYAKAREVKKEVLLEQERKELQTYKDYADIVDIFSKIENKEIDESPLFFEWNVWRALTMLDDGEIVGNFRVDEAGAPLYPAPGNMADIVCKYSDFEVIVEVTMSSGQKQYEMEGEPVARHFGDHKRATKKDVYCIFIAPTLNGASVAHYYMLYRTNVERYGGKAKIIPLSLDEFKVLLANAAEAKDKPKSTQIHDFLKTAAHYAETSQSELDWKTKISEQVKTTFLST